MSTNASDMSPGVAARASRQPRGRAAPRAPSAGLTLRDTARIAAWIAGALTLVAWLVAVVVRLALADQVRRWLAFRFTGFPAPPHVATAILLHNLGALGALLGLVLIAQSPHWARRPAGRVHRALRRVAELVIAAVVAANVIVVGASVGAYGIRMVRALLPHGPVEVAAYSLALALYIQGRERPLPLRHALVILGLATSALAVAAVLETFA